MELTHTVVLMGMQVPLKTEYSSGARRFLHSWDPASIKGGMSFPVSLHLAYSLFFLESRSVQDDGRFLLLGID